MGAKCPKCYKDGLEYDDYFKAARCVYAGCNFFEQMTKSEYEDKFEEKKQVSFAHKLTLTLK
ncbi:MAG: hypothetical protein COW32_09055 [Candidatus Aquicultor secundus]|uniref:hypothetical protein n=1 Tax=Candidatus Aquicultor secundus TaxID=1973895 RepID=UPI000CC3922A|nr:hypothetical protein [Candidatus Aquicultor secundus]NCO65632.1 hypothetical protein [Solirubrobacter sp.]PIU26609.1 MAG: hypothetical protein COT10_07810 [Candidatus Aquicultor secundus]PIW21609.1 MAG: hypothetical protein COW32_09055 [Candidatus Aquicultor secundus]